MGDGHTFLDKIHFKIPIKMKSLESLEQEVEKKYM